MTGHVAPALDSWSTWQCPYCPTDGEACDDDAATRALRVHVRSYHFAPGNGLAASLPGPATMTP